MIQLSFINLINCYNNFPLLMSEEYQKFPQLEELKSKDIKYTIGKNKSGREWKLGVNRVPNKNWRNRGSILTWEEKTKLKQQKQQIRSHIKQYKQKKIQKRKENKERAKDRKRQKQLNEIRAGKFEVVKNPKAMRKWNKKLKKQLVKLPAEVFESLMAPK